MAKRKAAVKDIIYELDNEDIDISSDDEVKEPKINRKEIENSTSISQNEENSKESGLENSNEDNTPDEVADISSTSTIQNGGKKTTDEIGNNETGTSSRQTEDEIDSVKKISNDCSKTTIFNEDIVIDSPGNSDLGVEGCENRTPLVTVRFRDNKLAMSYKEQVKAFMLNLIKLHEGEGLMSDNETDVELDIWPEDLIEEKFAAVEAPEENNLFFVDTDPCADQPDDIPRYRQASTVISNIPEKEPSPPPLRRGPCCFNCDGSHQLRECVLPRDFARIAEKRKTMNSLRVGRYHVEDEQKYGHLIPGRISGQLRHALGLKRNELPLHIYRMRLLGYPPGWLEEARISHSGISMFDSAGNPILEPEEEEGEVCEPGSKDKFDIKKILDFPGFNVPASSRYIEEAHQLGFMPMSEQDSKMSMLQFLAPNAMKAYKRKKLTFFPSASVNVTLEGQAEMDLDSGDEVAEFPSNPPLPDEAPPPPPPPPACPPPPISPPESPPKPPANELPACPKSPAEDKTESSGDDLEVTNVIQISDIPVPVPHVITIDDDGNSQSSGRGSPSLDDLEEKKRLLLNALEGDGTLNTSVISILDTTDDIIEDIDKTIEIIDEKMDLKDIISINDDNSQENVESTADDNEIASTDNDDLETKSQEIESDVQTPEASKVAETSSPKVPELNEVKSQETSPEIPSTPESKPGHVKGTTYGTPVMNIASPYEKLPTDDKFSKDICDVINFENLPNSTGKYKQISVLLRKVKSEVDRIQDS